MKKCVIVDVHGVITDGGERKRFMRVMQEKYGMDYDTHNDLWVRHMKTLDTGKEKASDYISEVNRVFNTIFSVKEYYGAFISQIVPNKGLLEHLGKIKDAKICILSDNFPPKSSGLNRVFGAKFKGYKKYFSYRTGRTKSDPVLFDYVVRDLRAKADCCVFIDDNESNVRTAERTGIKSILFRDTDSAIKALSELIQT